MPFVGLELRECADFAGALDRDGRAFNRLPRLNQMRSVSVQARRMISRRMMKQLLLLAGAAALASAAPAFAKPDHAKGHGKPNHAKAKVHDGDRGHWGYGIGGCPPGLAKKNNGCLPPGQAKKLYNIGQRFPLGYGHRWGFEQIPYGMRTQYGFDPRSNYYYGDGYLYRVDPRTMLISQVVNAILR